MKQFILLFISLGDSYALTLVKGLNVLYYLLSWRLCLDVQSDNQRDEK